MSNDSIIMELFVRVKKLEEKIETLEGKVNQAEEQEVSNDEEAVQSINSVDSVGTRTYTRNRVAHKLKQNNPQFKVRKANQKEGLGLVLTSEDDKILYVKYYHSKSFGEFPSGWNTIDKNDVEENEYDIYMFGVSFENDLHTFSFTRSELKEFVSKKKVVSDSKYYFYFHVYEDGRIVEVRDGEFDVSKYYQRWNLPSKLV